MELIVKNYMQNTEKWENSYWKVSEQLGSTGIIWSAFTLIIDCICYCILDIRSFQISLDGSRNVRLFVEGEQKDSISLRNPSSSQTSALLAYRPNYNDYHESGLGALFVSVQDVFTCTAEITNWEPVCNIFTREEDGFRKGNAFIQAADNGIAIPVFGGKSVWGVAVQNCPEFNNECLSNYLQFEVVCMLPRCQCPWVW